VCFRNVVSICTECALWLESFASSLLNLESDECWELLKRVYEKTKDPFLFKSIEMVEVEAGEFNSRGKFRCWIRYSLNTCILTHFLQLIYEQRDLTE
jgi:hypothetical protein